VSEPADESVTPWRGPAGPDSGSSSGSAAPETGVDPSRGSLAGALARRRRQLGGWADRLLLHPARLIPLGLFSIIVVGVGLLLLPVSTADTASDTGAPVRTAFFTATSAVCVTGLVVVDTVTHWSTTGHVVLLVLFQVGGLGIATLSSLVAIALFRRTGLRSLLAAGRETRGDIGSLRSVLPSILLTTAVVEAVISAFLAGRFFTAYDMDLPQALWYGVFHGISAFNNAGFALYGDSLVRFATDPWIVVPVMTGVVLGGLGFPVLVELARVRSPRLWSVHTRLVLVTSAVLLVAGALALGALEWGNPATLGALDWPSRVMAAVFMSVTARSSGFATIDYAEVGDAALLVTSGLMFVGAGSAGTSGGIKVGTLAVLVLAAVAEVRGDTDVHVFGRRISTATVRQALVVLGVSTILTGVAVVFLLQTTDFALADVLFEATSATGVVGLSTGITGDLPPAAQWFVTAAMFVGRVGPVAVAAAVAGTERRRLYRYPEAKPLIG
jgi:Trk-type K+ transport system membrane component